MPAFMFCVRITVLFFTIILDETLAQQTVAWGAGSVLPPAGFNASSMLALDWDEDGRLDLLLLDQAGSRISWSSSNGPGGSFAAFTTLATIPSPAGRHLQHGQIRAQGYEDLVVASDSEVMWFESLGGGFLNPTPNIFSDSPSGSGVVTALAVANMNTSSALSAVVTSVDFFEMIDTVVHIDPTSGAGHEDWLPPFNMYRVVDMHAGFELYAGDGSPDIVVLLEDGAIVYYEATQQVGRTRQLATSVLDTFVLYDVNTALGFIPADIDSDGFTDLVYQSNLDGLLKWARLYDEAAGQEAFAEFIIPSTGATLLSMQVADLDGDLDLDLIVASLPSAAASQEANIFWNENLGGGNFSSPELVGTFSQTEELTLSSMLIFDADDDLDNDVMILQAGATSSNVVLFQNLLYQTAAPTPAPSSAPPVATGVPVSTSTPVATAPALTPAPTAAPTPMPTPGAASSVRAMSTTLVGETADSWSAAEQAVFLNVLGMLHGSNISISIVVRSPENDLAVAGSADLQVAYNITSESCLDAALQMDGDEGLFATYTKELAAQDLLVLENTATYFVSQCDGVTVSSLITETGEVYSNWFETGENAGMAATAAAGVALVLVGITSMIGATAAAPAAGLGSPVAAAQANNATFNSKGIDSPSPGAASDPTPSQASRSSSQSSSVKLMAAQGQYLALAGLIGSSSGGSYVGFTSPLRRWFLMWVHYNGDTLAGGDTPVARRHLAESEDAGPANVFIGNTMVLLGGFLAVIFLSVLAGAAIQALMLAREREKSGDVSRSVSSADIAGCQEKSDSVLLFFPHLSLLWILFSYEGAVSAQAAVLRHPAVNIGISIAAALLLFIFSITLAAYAALLHRKRSACIHFHEDNLSKDGESIWTLARAGILTSWRRGESIMDWATFGEWRSKGGETLRTIDRRRLRIGFEPFFIDFTDRGSLFFHWLLIRMLVLGVVAGCTYSDGPGTSTILPGVIFLVALFIEATLILITRPFNNHIINAMQGLLVTLDAGIAGLKVAEARVGPGALSQIQDIAVILGLVSLGVVLIPMYIDSAMAMTGFLAGLTKKGLKKALSAPSRTKRAHFYRHALSLWPRIVCVSVSIAMSTTAQQLKVQGLGDEEEADHHQEEPWQSKSVQNPLYKSSKLGEQQSKVADWDLALTTD
jgi:hypothetical protein